MFNLRPECKIDVPQIPIGMTIQYLFIKYVNLLIGCFCFKYDKTFSSQQKALRQVPAGGSD